MTAVAERMPGASPGTSPGPYRWWLVTYRYCYTDVRVKVEANTDHEALVQAYFQSPIIDWCIFRRFIRAVRPM